MADRADRYGKFAGRDQVDTAVSLGITELLACGCSRVLEPGDWWLPCKQIKPQATPKGVR